MPKPNRVTPPVVEDNPTSSGWPTDSAIARAPFAIIECDRQGFVRGWNRMAEELYRWSAAEAIGKQHLAIPPEARDSERELTRRALAGETVAGVLAKRVRRDGTPFEVLLAVGPLRDERGKIVGTMRFARDVAAGLPVLLESEERYRLAMETASDAVISIDEASRITFANHSSEGLFGYSVHELVGSELTMLMPEAFRPRHLRALGNYLRTGVPSRSWHAIPLTGLHRDGREIPIEVSFGVSDSDGGRRFTAFVRDVTERVRTEEQIRTMERVESVGQLAGGVAHDFNNLLTVIIGHTDMLRDSIKSPELQSHLDAIERAAERATNLTNQLLAFGRRQVLNPAVLDADEVLADVEPLLRRVAGENIHVELMPAPATLRIRFDRNRLGQVLINLAANARDAMPNGGTLRIEVGEVELGAADRAADLKLAAGPFVVIAVSDTGNGIPPDVRARIFEPFFTTKETMGGSGLGLSTALGIVRQSDGDIEVETEPGAGATFRLYLPRVYEEPDLPSAASIRDGSLAGTETIMVVEDDSGVRDLARDALQRLGYRVLVADRPASAVRRAAEHPGTIDLLVADVVMPGMSGAMLAVELRRQQPNLRVLYISGHAENAIAHHGVFEPGTDFLPKPYTADTLARRIRQIFSR